MLAAEPWEIDRRAAAAEWGEARAQAQGADWRGAQAERIALVAAMSHAAAVETEMPSGAALEVIADRARVPAVAADPQAWEAAAASAAAADEGRSQKSKEEY